MVLASGGAASAAISGRGNTPQSSTLTRISKDKQLATLTDQRIKKAAMKTERHLMRGHRADKKFIAGLVRNFKK